MGGDSGGAEGALASHFSGEGAKHPHFSSSKVLSFAQASRLRGIDLLHMCCIEATSTTFQCWVLVMAKRQASLIEWCGPTKKGKESSPIESDGTSSLAFPLGNAAEPSSSTASTVISASTVSQSGETETDGEETDEGEIRVSNCTAVCCANSGKAYQPTHKQVLCQLILKGRNFQPQWYKQFT